MAKIQKNMSIQVNPLFSGHSGQPSECPFLLGWVVTGLAALKINMEQARGGDTVTLSAAIN